MIVTGNNFKLYVAKGIFSIGALHTIHRINLYPLPFTDNLCSLITGYLRALVQSVDLHRRRAGCEKAHKGKSHKNTHKTRDVIVIGSLHGI